MQTTLLDWPSSKRISGVLEVPNTDESMRIGEVDEVLESEGPSTIEEHRDIVLATMYDLEVADHAAIDSLTAVPLGRLRRNATRLHAVCRYRRKLKSSGPLGTSDVREVALHPVALEEGWARYARFLLYHEFLHALGNVGHDARFRELEARWPDEEARHMGPAFGAQLRQRANRWIWTCPDCGRSHSRSRRSNGRYLCRACRIPLTDVDTRREEP